MRIYDITVPISATLPTFPGDPKVSIEPVSRLETGDGANLSRLCISTHCGTHLDAPRHFNNDGLPVDRIPLELLVGTALVVEIPGVQEIGRRELARLPLKGEQRVLLKTDNSWLWELAGFYEDYACLTEEGARYLVEIGVKLVGIDYLSIEKFEGSGEIHRLLLDNNIIILEGINLKGVKPDNYELLCLPLKLQDGDGAPVRALLRKKATPAGGEFDPHTTKWPLA